MSAVVRLKDVWAMLDDCAKGHSRKAVDHRWIVYYAGKTYRRLPLGPHGRRENPEIESGHVRGMIRHLGIKADCAEKHLNLS